MHTVKPLYLKAILLTVGTALWLALTACGAATDPASALSVSLEIPAYDDPEIFWIGLDRRELTIEGDRETRTFPWQAGQLAEFSAEAGEKITFSAYDSRGSLRVQGQARVGKEKRITIPVRQLYN